MPLPRRALIFTTFLLGGCILEEAPVAASGVPEKFDLSFELLEDGKVIKSKTVTCEPLVKQCRLFIEESPFEPRFKGSFGSPDYVKLFLDPVPTGAFPTIKDMPSRPLMVWKQTPRSLRSVVYWKKGPGIYRDRNLSSMGRAIISFDRFEQGFEFDIELSQGRPNFPTRGQGRIRFWAKAPGK